MNALRAFEAAARHLSFRSAGDELNVTHSAISHQIKTLEARLQVQLFHRGARSIELTDAGQAYYPILRDAFDRIADGTERLNLMDTISVLTAQVYSTFAVRWLIPRLHDFQQSYPGIQVRISTSARDVDFDHDDVDVGVIMGEKLRADLRYDFLFSSDMFPVCSPSLLKSTKPLETPRDLEHHTLLHVYPALEDWELWLTAAKVEGVNPQDGPKFDSYLLALEAAVDGLGVALARRPFAARDLKAGRLIAPFALSVPKPGAWYLVYRKERADSRKIAGFREWLVGQAHSDPDILPAGRAPDS